MLQNFKIWAFTHKNLTLKELGEYVIDDSGLKAILKSLKEKLFLSELVYIATCNRVEFLFVTHQKIDEHFLSGFIKTIKTEWDQNKINAAIKNGVLYEAESAVEHLLCVSSSLDSLVVGEKEIFAQVRKAYEDCKLMNITGDVLRLVINRMIKTSKEIFTYTKIANNPVSVVSLAYRNLKDLNIDINARVLIVGSGKTCQLMTRYLLKHGFKNFAVFNRTLENACFLAGEVGGKAFPLNELQNYQDGFDVIVTSTASSQEVITEVIYSKLLKNDVSRKIIIDLAIPHDTDQAILKKYNVQYISIDHLQVKAADNMLKRKDEVEKAKTIILENILEFRQVVKQRELELALNKVPQKVKEIRNTAVSQVYAEKINKLDPSSKALLDEILNYFEEKYISVPIKMAKEILIEK